MTRQEMIEKLLLVQHKLLFVAGEISINTPVLEAIAILTSILTAAKAGPITE